MSNRPTKKPDVTFLFSDTGGGHRAAAEAIIESIHLEYGDGVVTTMVDFLKDYAPPPFNHLPDIYPDLVKVPELWGAFFDISDGRPQARFVTSTFWPYVRRAAQSNCGVPAWAGSAGRPGAAPEYSPART